MEFKSQVLRTISPKEGPKTLKAKSTCLGRGEHELELDLGLDGGGRRMKSLLISLSFSYQAKNEKRGERGFK